MQKTGLLFLTLMMGVIIACSSNSARLDQSSQSSQSTLLMPDRIESRQELTAASGSAMNCVPTPDAVEMTRMSYQTASKKKVNPTITYTGVASWYGEEFHGKEVASSTPKKKKYFNMWAKTAACKSMPMGSRVKVTNMKNGRSVVVKITDDGPNNGRLIDLSLGAFAEIAKTKVGLIKVRVTLL